MHYCILMQWCSIALKYYNKQKKFLKENQLPSQAKDWNAMN